ncbi:MAG: selenide, water dikinase SelD [Bacteroidetes bacterium]|nr:selenide, water dikinase SelD [Bacteroidota bacterium]
MNSEKDIIPTIRLTQFSHGAGCGCKISPAILSEILKNNETPPDFNNLLVGNHSRDDAAVLDIGNGQALISTTDFFMPIVDDAFEFGRIAATNAISDVYAMGGKPVLAIAILGWPIDKLSPEIAGRVIAGGRKACSDADIPLAGGHSIDSPEPIFGLSVNGIVVIKNLKKNSTAQVGDRLFLTKKLGIGILATASKKDILSAEDLQTAIESMTTLNKIGEELGKLDGVHALTDVTGFGLLGHLAEMTEGSGLSATIFMKNVPVIPAVQKYLDAGAVPGGTHRNWKSYGENISPINEYSKLILADPQTSGGLLIALDPQKVDSYTKCMKEAGFEDFAMIEIGMMVERGKYLVSVEE